MQKLAALVMADGGRSTVDAHPAGLLCASIQAVSNAIAASSDLHSTAQQSDVGMSCRLKMNANSAGRLLPLAGAVDSGANDSSG